MSNYVTVLERVRNRSAKTENDHQEEGENGALGQYVTQQYGLLQLVLSNLPIKDLRNAAQVCRTWCVAARAIARSRLKPHTMIWYDVEDLKNSIEETCKEILKSQHSEPDLAIVFMNFPACHRIECSEKSCIRCSKVLKCIRSELLRRCLLVNVRLPNSSGNVSSCYNCLMKQRDLANVEAWSMINPMIQGFSAAFIPRVPGVTISVFHVRSKYYNSVHWKESLSDEELDEIPGMPPKTQPLRCVVLFHNFGVHNPGLFVKSLEARHGKFAAGGGLCKDATLASGGFGPSDWSIFGIALSGLCIQAASLVVDHEEQSADRLDEDFLKVRNCMGSMKNSLAIWFAPNEPSFQFQYDNRITEYKCFKRHFPTTPLTGGYTLHKIGRTHLPGMPDDWKNKSLCQKHASVFIFLSFTQQPVP